jgi:hypothetical protein
VHSTTDTVDAFTYFIPASIISNMPSKSDGCSPVVKDTNFLSNRDNIEPFRAKSWLRGLDLIRMWDFGYIRSQLRS